LSCEYVGCNEEGYVELTFNSRHYTLCRKHYLVFQDLMYNLALQYGEATISSLKLVKAGRRLRIEPSNPLSRDKASRVSKSLSRFLGLIKGVKGIVKTSEVKRKKVKRTKARRKRAKRK